MPTFKVAVLDDYQGLSKAHFSKLDPSLYEVTYLNDTLLPYAHPDTPKSVKDQLAKRLQEYQVICTMRERTPFPEDLIRALPNLKLLLTTGTRNNALDLPTFKSRGIPVAGTGAHPDPSIKKKGTSGPDSTTQHCVTLILSLARNIARDDLSVKTGGWQTGLATGLAGKTLGVVGLGRLGVATAKVMSLAFGMNIIAWSTNLTQDAADEKARGAGLPVEDADGEKTFKVVSREELFSTADVVSLHLVLSDRSRGIINKDGLSRMKSTSFLVNTSRGPLVVESDLLETLRQGRIAGAALDVFELEPLPADSPWRSQKWGEDGSSQVLLTPHMGYVEKEVLSSWYEQQVAQLERWTKGEALQHVLA